MKKSNNKILLIVLVFLVAAFVVTKIFRSPALESNLDTELFAIDTALIRSISLQRPGQPEIILKKNDTTWTVHEGQKQANVHTDAIDNFMRTLSQVKPERIVTRNEGKWPTYQVDDSTSIHMTAFDQDDVPVIDWYIGKESTGVTYIRPADEEAVYAMEGSLRNRTDDDFNDWRDKTFARVKPASITKITFTYPADSGFVLQKNETAWMIGDQRADSAQVQRYLQKFQSRNLSDFAEEFSSSDDPDVTLSVETSNGDPTVIKAWKMEEDRWTLNSSLQKDAYFSDARIDNDLFIGRKSLLKTE